MQLKNNEQVFYNHFLYDREPGKGILTQAWLGKRLGKQQTLLLKKRLLNLNLFCVHIRLQAETSGLCKGVTKKDILVALHCGTTVKTFLLTGETFNWSSLLDKVTLRVYWWLRTSETHGFITPLCSCYYYERCYTENVQSIFPDTKSCRVTQGRNDCCRRILVLHCSTLPRYTIKLSRLFLRFS